MKLENLEKALEQHLATVRNAQRSPGGSATSLEERRDAAYREMTLKAWEDYRQLRLTQAEADFVDEVLQSGLPGAVKSRLIGQAGHKRAE
jgi:hypothetical protein